MGRIVSLYDMPASANPSPVIALNRVVAVAMRDEPAAGIALFDTLLERGDLPDYGLRLAGIATHVEEHFSRTSIARIIHVLLKQPTVRCAV